MLRAAFAGETTLKAGLGGLTFWWNGGTYRNESCTMTKRLVPVMLMAARIYPGKRGRANELAGGERGFYEGSRERGVLRLGIRALYRLRGHDW